MRFKLATLLWLITFASVLVGAYVWIQSERRSSEQRVSKITSDAKKEIAIQRDEYDAFRQGTMKIVRNEIASARYPRRKLGIIEGAEEMTKPYVKYVRLPDELGGKRHHGLPFIWQWRMLIPKPSDLEICWAVDAIPEDDSFELPVEKISRSVLDEQRWGGTSFGNIRSRFERDDPVEVILYFRIDGDKEGGSVNLSYEVAPPGAVRNWSTTLKSEKTTRLSPENIQWFLDCSTSRGDYSIAGLSIDHSATKIPLLDGALSFDEPILLLKARSRKRTGPIEFEQFKGPCRGLLIWLQKTDSQKRNEDAPSVDVIPN